jgi:ankyrin repeat protein
MYSEWTAGSSGRTAFMQASNYGYEDAVVLLIDHGVVVNQQDNKGRSALMYAANGQYVDAIPHLLSHGADAYARDLDGKTALDLARCHQRGCDPAVQLGCWFSVGVILTHKRE